MELTSSFTQLLQYFVPVFTTPSFQTFGAIFSGWVLSQRRRFITEIIFSGGNTGRGHWSRFHRFFSQAAWDADILSMHLAKLVVRLFCLGGTIGWAIDDTLCRKRGLTLYGAGMHHDPLISSKAKPLVSWGHDWVVLCLILVHPFWAPSKVFALPIAMRLYRNRQGLTKGKKGKTNPANPDHRTRPQLASELIALVSTWFPNDELVVTGDSAYGGKSVLSHLPDNVHLISHVHPKGALYLPPPAPDQHTKGRRRKKGNRLPGMADWANDSTKPWTTLPFDQFGLHACLKVKTQQALYYKAGGSRLLTIVLTRDVDGKRPDQMFYCTKLDWDARQILSAYSQRWAIECTFEDSKQLLGFEDPANRLPQAVKRTAPMALVLYSLIVVWTHQSGYFHIHFPFRPWYRHKREPSFADLLTTLRRVTYEELMAPLLSEHYPQKPLLEKIIDLLSRAG